MICGACVCVSQVTPNNTNELFLLIDYRNLLFMNLGFLFSVTDHLLCISYYQQNMYI